jgi:GNAT superfamily N-acetyltransferase
VRGDGVTVRLIGGEEAAAGLAELRAVYADAYSEEPYRWGQDHARLFAERFEIQSRRPGFALAQARDGAELVGFAFGVTLQPATPWWDGLTTALPPEITTERPGRTFALVELVVRASWRRQGIAEAMHDLLLRDRPEERATLTVLPAATPAQAAYRKWGWQRIAQKHNPLPGSPLFDLLVKTLT